MIIREMLQFKLFIFEKLSKSGADATISNPLLPSISLTPSENKADLSINAVLTPLIDYPPG
jgi:hypothetical protein